jgi:exodeoxyribonuclease VIII
MIQQDKIIFDLPMSEYIADPGIGSGQLKSILQSPAEYQWHKKYGQKETRALVLGTAIHTWVLEPHKFHREYAVPPEDWGSLVANPARQKWADFKKHTESQGKTPLKYRDAIWLLEFAERAKRHEGLQAISATGVGTEVTAAIEVNGVRYKARTDLLTRTGLWDVKTSAKGLDDHEIERTIFTMGYHFQAAHHLRVFSSIDPAIQSFGWIFITKDGVLPQIRCLKAAEQWLHFGTIDWDAAHQRLLACTAAKSWPDAYSDDITVVNMPDWAIRNSMPEGEQ